MSVFDPESSHNRFWSVLEDLRDTDDPYQFGIYIDFEGKTLVMNGLSMGDMVTINREIAQVIREAKHARAL